MFSGVYASTRLVHTCSLACTPAQGSCTHVLRRASQHKTRARMFSGVHASTRLVHACSTACMSAQGTCTHAEPCAGVHAGGPRTQGVRAIRRPAFVARGLGYTLRNTLMVDTTNFTILTAFRDPAKSCIW